MSTEHPARQAGQGEAPNDWEDPTQAEVAIAGRYLRELSGTFPPKGDALVWQDWVVKHYGTISVVLRVYAALANPARQAGQDE